MIKSDHTLLDLLEIEVLPSTDAIGDWLRCSDAGEGLSGLSRINERIVVTRVRQTRVADTHWMEMHRKGVSLNRNQVQTSSGFIR